MALTPTQQGIIGQTEVAKLIVIGSGGAIEVAWPWTDDDHRDIEVHRKGFVDPVALQVKTTWRFWVHRKSEVIQILFTLPQSRVLDDPTFWYVFAYMDPETMALRDPLFLVPSKVVHDYAEPHLVGSRWHFTFEASLKAGSKDRWSAYRVAPNGLGKRLL